MIYTYFNVLLNQIPIKEIEEIESFTNLRKNMCKRFVR